MIILIKYLMPITCRHCNIGVFKRQREHNYFKIACSKTNLCSINFVEEVNEQIFFLNVQWIVVIKFNVSQTGSSLNFFKHFFFLLSLILTRSFLHSFSSAKQIKIPGSYFWIDATFEVSWYQFYPLIKSLFFLFYSFFSSSL